MDKLTRQQYRQFQRKLQNPNYKEGYFDGADQTITMFEKALSEALVKVKGIGEKRAAEIQKHMNGFFKRIAEDDKHASSI